MLCGRRRRRRRRHSHVLWIMIIIIIRTALLLLSLCAPGFVTRSRSKSGFTFRWRRRSRLIPRRLNPIIIMFSFAKSRATVIFRRRVPPARRAIITVRCRGRDTVLRVGIPSRCRYRTRLRRAFASRKSARGHIILTRIATETACPVAPQSISLARLGKVDAIRFFFFFVKFLVLVVSRVRISGCLKVLPKRSENVVRFVQFPSAWTRKISIFIQRSN